MCGQANTFGALFDCRRTRATAKIQSWPHRQVRSDTTQGGFEKSLETDEEVLS